VSAGLDLEMRSYGATDVGMRREANEDAFLRDDELGLWIVADGMGGHAAGEVASQEAIDAIYSMVKRGKESLFASSPSAAELMRSASRLLEGAVQSATYMVFGLAQMDSGRMGMGTTISSMFRCGSLLILGQVGDSRIYRVRGSEVLQLTEDHTLVAWQLKRGLITEEQAKVSRQRNVITRAVGNRDYVQVDIIVAEAEMGDQYLLCSDGLHGYLNVPEIAEIANLGGQHAVERFIDLANERGGKDNITAILLETS